MKKNKKIKEIKKEFDKEFNNKKSDLKKSQNNIESYDRVQKIISNAGYCSRRKAEELIKKGVVKVNDKIITIGDKAGPKDKITVDNKPLLRVKKGYFMMHKENGLITTKDDLFGRKTVMSVLRKNIRDQGVYPVGRLDKNTTGILLLTNDGDFANKVLHPSYEVRKTYVAKLDRPFRNKNKIESGVMIDNKLVKGKIKVLNPATIVEISIHEGMNHIVKKIFETVGYKVLKLSRIKIGIIKLDIPPGKVRSLHKSEINYFKELKKKHRIIK